MIKFNYPELKRPERGILIAFLVKVTGYSRQQMTRLVKRYKDTGEIKYTPSTTQGFKKRYQAQDIRLLAKMDTLHHIPNGAAVKKLCERAVKVYQQTEYENLSHISISHLYNLRKSHTYQLKRQVFTKTRPKASSIGVRKKPNPHDQPGYICIDTVHQGDLAGQKGVYHINAVDEVTQFEVVVTVEKISEHYLIPALRFLLESFPFNLHSDNGSEYINQRVAKPLEKLHIEFTKSRPRHSNDNGLVESKNASIVRKTVGYTHIPQHFADRINAFNREYLNPYINYHRPCYFPEVIVVEKGKQQRKYTYDKMTTPFEKLKALPEVKRYLNQGSSLDLLEKTALSMTDNEAADKLNQARKQLFEEIFEQMMVIG